MRAKRSQMSQGPGPRILPPHQNGFLADECAWGGWQIGDTQHWDTESIVSYQSGRHSGCTGHGPGMGGEYPGHIGPEPAGLPREGSHGGTPHWEDKEKVGGGSNPESWVSSCLCQLLWPGRQPGYSRNSHLTFQLCRAISDPPPLLGCFIFNNLFLLYVHC